jgi:glycosyltransferase involved in cell wall biosynthesis
MQNNKLIRITTVPISLKSLLKGQHRFMSQNGFKVVGVSSSGPELDDVASSEGVSVKEIEMTRTISPLKDLVALWKFYKLCKEEKPNIVHSHTPKAGIIGMLGARLARVPIRIHTVAGLPLMETSGIKRKILDFVERLTYKSATSVFPNSYGLLNFIQNNNYISADKLKVIANGSSNGIDTTYFTKDKLSLEQIDIFKQDLGISNTDFIYVFVGRLVGDKGINELVSAFKALNNIKIKLLLVGPMESDLDPLLNSTIHEINNNPQIISVGFQADVRPYFAISDCLVFPSYREGFPNVVMQAGAMGLPSIVTDINGCNEIIIEGVNGTILPSKDKKALKEAMLRIYNDHNLRHQLASNARQMIVDRYEQQMVWDALLDEYQFLIKTQSKINHG